MPGGVRVAPVSLAGPSPARAWRAQAGWIEPAGARRPDAEPSEPQNFVQKAGHEAQFQRGSASK